MNIVETPAPGGTLLTLYKEKQPVGSCLLCPQAEGVRIERLEIDPAWRRRGYGSYLLRQALHRTGGFEKGRASLYTAALPADEGAGAFAARFGFAAAEGALVRRRTPPLTAVELTHRFLAAHLHPGGKFLDATCGNGGDTEFLCRLAGPEGWVLGLDIQARAVANTNARLAAAGFGAIGRAVQADHADLAAYLPEGGIDAAVFNFGYLPGADHHRFSTPATSLPALEAALAALRPGGLLAACLYSGGPNGDGEKKAVLAWLERLPLTRYTVLEARFANWAETAPLPCFVLKNP